MDDFSERNEGPPFTCSEIETWLRIVVAELLRITPAEVSPDARLARLGVDSTTALIVTDMLCEWLGQELEPALLYRFPTIAALSTHLAALSEFPDGNPHGEVLHE